MGSFWLVKLVLCFVIVVVVAEISKKISPHLGGMLAGLPLGTGVAVYFIAYEQGISFALEGVPWGIAGLAGSILFCQTYFQVVRWTQSSKVGYSVALASFASTAAFVTAGLLLSRIPLDLLRAAGLFLIAYVFNLILVHRFAHRQERHTPLPTTAMQMVFRVVAVWTILLLVTGSAAILGSRPAMILSSFPAMLLPLLVVLQWEVGNNVLYVIKGFSSSISALAVFYLLFYYFVPVFGLNAGYALIYAVCIAYVRTDA